MTRQQAETLADYLLSLRVSRPMTTVEDATQIVTQPRRRAAASADATTGFWSWFTTVDHKKIGILYVCTALSSSCSAGSRRC